MKATFSIDMAESDQKFSYSTSEEDLESSESMEEDTISYYEWNKSLPRRTFGKFRQ